MVVLPVMILGEYSSICYLSASKQASCSQNLKKNSLLKCHDVLDVSRKKSTEHISVDKDIVSG
jgi:hypothetical protein